MASKKDIGATKSARPGRLKGRLIVGADNHLHIEGDDRTLEQMAESGAGKAKLTLFIDLLGAARVEGTGKESDLLKLLQTFLDKYTAGSVNGSVTTGKPPPPPPRPPRK